jgi:hypothetical protein
MRTEHDIRQALATLEREAPDPADVLAAVTEPSRPPARPRILVAVAAATALAVAVPVIALRADSEPAAPAAWPGPGDDPAQRWQFAFDVAVPTGWKSLNRAIGDFFGTDVSSQQQQLNASGGQLCTLIVYKPGAFDERRIPAERTRIEINGRPGYVANVRRPSAVNAPKPKAVGERGEPAVSMPPVKTAPPGPSVVWRYARNAWALSTCDMAPGQRPRDAIVADERTLAEATTFGLTPLRVPFKVTTLPNGWTGYQISSEGPAWAGWPQPDIWLNVVPPGTTTARLNENVSILFTKGVPGRPTPGSTRLTINGLPAWLSADRSTLTVQGDGFELRVQSRGASDKLLQIAKGLRLASDPLDETTWFDGVDAIP